MKKIFFLINSLYSGGAERIGVNLTSYLEEDYDWYVYGIEQDKFYDLANSINYRSLTSLKYVSSSILKFLCLPVIFYRYYKEVKKHNPDILLSALNVANVINILIGKLLLKKKTYLWMHINPKQQYSKGFFGKLMNFFIKRIYSKSDKIIVVSKAIKHILIKHYNIKSSKIEVIYNPHQIIEYLNKGNQKLPQKDTKYFSKNKINFITVGRLNEQKGQWIMIKIFAHLKTITKKKFNLIILGQGELKNDLQQLIKKYDLVNDVHLLGNRTNPFIYVKNSDYFILTSLWEGLPNTLIEALSMGTHIITSDCETGPREILAPEVPLNKFIKYPLKTKYGLLIKSNEDDVDSKIEITTEEKMAANVISKYMIKTATNEDSIKRSYDFETKKCLKLWLKLFR